MSTDITASKSWVYDEHLGYSDTENEVASFTLTCRLNDYCGTICFFDSNADEIIVEEGDNVYVYSRETIIKLQEMNKTLNLGVDVDNFLKTCLDSDADKLYIEIL